MTRAARVTATREHAAPLGAPRDFRAVCEVGLSNSLLSRSSSQRTMLYEMRFASQAIPIAALQGRQGDRYTTTVLPALMAEQLHGDSKCFLWQL